MKVELVWATPKIDENIAYMARVSNPNASPDDPHEKLIKYLLDHKHWSPFEMACMCVEITTTRDIARQILRHRAFHFQEFSQRYAVAPEEPEYSEARLQDVKNRQNSHSTEDQFISSEWARLQNFVWDTCWTAYQVALKLGIAKELARKLLPEGLTVTRMYMQGTVRDWIHYIWVRTAPGVQHEHQEVAWAILDELQMVAPITCEVAIAGE